MVLKNNGAAKNFGAWPTTALLSHIIITKVVIMLFIWH